MAEGNRKGKEPVRNPGPVEKLRQQITESYVQGVPVERTPVPSIIHPPPTLTGGTLPLSRSSNPPSRSSSQHAEPRDSPVSSYKESPPSSVGEERGRPSTPPGQFLSGHLPFRDQLEVPSPGRPASQRADRGSSPESVSSSLKGQRGSDTASDHRDDPAAEPSQRASQRADTSSSPLPGYSPPPPYARATRTPSPSKTSQEQPARTGRGGIPVRLTTRSMREAQAGQLSGTTTARIPETPEPRAVASSAHLQSLAQRQRTSAPPSEPQVRPQESGNNRAVVKPSGGSKTIPAHFPMPGAPMDPTAVPGKAYLRPRDSESKLSSGSDSRPRALEQSQAPAQPILGSRGSQQSHQPQQQQYDAPRSEQSQRPPPPHRTQTQPTGLESGEQRLQHPSASSASVNQTPEEAARHFPPGMESHDSSSRRENEGKGKKQKKKKKK